MGLGIKTYFKNRIVKGIRESQIEAEQAREEFLVMQYYDKSKLKELTKEERFSIQSMWGAYKPF